MTLKRGIARLAVIVASISAATSAQAAEPWKADISKDAISDAEIREACSATDDFRMCFSFNDKGVWVTMRALRSDTFDSKLFPAFRVDQNKAIEFVTATTLDLERLTGPMIPRHWEPGHISWRANIPSKTGGWTDTPPNLIQQMISGQQLLVRVYLSGGYQRDVTFPLAGFCKAAAAVYAVGAPPLQCPS